MSSSVQAQQHVDSILYHLSELRGQRQPKEPICVSQAEADAMIAEGGDAKTNLELGLKIGRVIIQEMVKC